MADVLQTPIFRRLAPQAAAVAGPLFTERALPPGGTLWFQDTVADELAIVLSGALSVRVGAQEVASVKAGEMVGEASAFFGERRTATVEASEPTRLLVLSRDGLVHLRATLPEVYEPLLDRALETMARRVRDTSKQIVLLASGGKEQPVRKKVSALAGLFKRSGPQEDRLLPVAPVLATLPALKVASPAAVTGIRTALVPRRFEADEVLFLEGEPGTSAFLVVEGTVEVVRNARGGKAETLATLAPGAIFGTGSLLLGDRRNASCVAGKVCRLAEMDQQAMAGLRGESGRAWRECLLTALRFQVVSAGSRLAQLKGGTSAEERERLRRAAAQVAAFNAPADADDPWSFMGRGAP